MGNERRMRTIQQAVSHFQSIDPGTALTKSALRRLVVTGAIPSVRIGSKYLIALEDVATFLHGTQSKPAAPSYGEIRKVSVKL